MICWSSKIIKEGDVVMCVVVLKEKELWLDLVGIKLDEVDGKWRLLNSGKGMCDVFGCGEKCKYWLVKDFERGGCCIEYLKVVEVLL